MKLFLNEIQAPIYLNKQFVWNPQDYALSNYKDRSRFESNVIEFWAPITDLVIPGVLPGVYWVSSWGNAWNLRTNQPIGLSEHEKGYYQLNLSGKDANGNYTRTCRKLHNAIMKTFCYFPGCDNFLVNHMDSNKINNNLKNLEWCTESQNTIHAINNDHKDIFTNYESYVYLTDDEVGEIYTMFCGGIPVSEIYNIIRRRHPETTMSLISGICHKHCRKAWFKAHGLL